MSLARHSALQWVFLLPPLVLTACRGGTDRVDPSTAEAVRTSLRQQIEVVSLQKGGYLFHPPDLGQVDTLSFDYVHDELLRQPDGTYYACVNFLSPTGDTLDLDMFVGQRRGAFRIERRVLHKVNGRIAPGYHKAMSN